MWLWLACQRLSFPDPVVLKRFMAARLVFCFGICIRLFGCNHHRHVAALELGIGLDLAHISQICRHPVEHRLAQLQMRHLPATEHHGHLDLVAVAEELPRMAGLEIKVMVVDARTVLHFLELNDVLLLLGGAGRLGFLELVFPVVHDLDDGRPGSGSYLHEIQSAFLGGREGLFDRQDPELLTGGGNHAHRADPDHAVHAGSFFAIVRGQFVPPTQKRKAPGDEPGAHDAKPRWRWPTDTLRSQDPVALRHDAGRLRVGECVSPLYRVRKLATAPMSVNGMIPVLTRARASDREAPRPSPPAPVLPLPPSGHARKSAANLRQSPRPVTLACSRACAMARGRTP